MSSDGRKRNAAARAKQEQHFRDVGASLAHGADVIAASKHEIERSRRLFEQVNHASDKSRSARRAVEGRQT
jgi:hypothetical protein